MAQLPYDQYRRWQSALDADECDDGLGEERHVRTGVL